METSGDIYHHEEKARIDTATIFKFTIEDDRLRVSNQNINILYKQLTPATFDEHYNAFHRYLNLNLDALNKSNLLKPEDVQPIEQV